MITVRVQADFASFRKPFAREYRATELLPPPSTCYGFLLSLCGIPRERYQDHVGVRISPALLSHPEKSTILRKFHRLKIAKDGVTAIPDFQEILSGVDVLIFVDSSDEVGSSGLEDLVREAIQNPSGVDRFGSLCLGESESIVNAVDLVDFEAEFDKLPARPRVFTLDPQGLISLTTWPDYDKCATTQWARGALVEMAEMPLPSMMPTISPSNTS